MFKTIDKLFLIAAFASVLLSAYLMLFIDREYGIFVGLWVPSILSLWIGLRVCMLGK